METETLPESAPEDDDVNIYGEDGAVRTSYLARVGAAIADRDVLFLRSHVGKLHQSELGHVLEALQPDQRRALVELLGDEFDFAALTEVDEAVRLEIVDAMPNRQIAEGVQELDSDDAVYILEDLEQEDRDEILAQLPFTERVRLRRSLGYPEETAGRRMQTEFVAVPPFWTVGQTIDYMRDNDDLPESSRRYSLSTRCSVFWAPSTSIASCVPGATSKSTRSHTRRGMRSRRPWTRKKPRKSSSNTICCRRRWWTRTTGWSVF